MRAFLSCTGSKKSLRRMETLLTPTGGGYKVISTSKLVTDQGLEP